MSMTNPLTPPPELVQQWLCSDDYLWGPLEQTSITITTNRLQNVATQAAQWGATKSWRRVVNGWIGSGRESKAENSAPPAAPSSRA